MCLKLVKNNFLLGFMHMWLSACVCSLCLYVCSKSLCVSGHVHAYASMFFSSYGRRFQSEYACLVPAYADAGLHT